MPDYSNRNVKEKTSILKQIKKINFEIDKLEKEKKRINIKINTKNEKIETLWKQFQGA